MAASRLARVVRAVACPTKVKVTFADGDYSVHHAYWLWDNCSSRRNASNQKSAFWDGSARAVISAAEVAPGGESLVVNWASPGGVSSYPAHLLRDHAVARALRAPAVHANHHLPPPLSRVSYTEYMASDAALYAALHGIAQHGACILEGAPPDVETIADAATRIAPIMPTIYGESWDVRDSPDAINVAYTTEALPLHMDLAYYESPPGLQLLHCVRFDAVVQGGESQLLDAVSACALFAEEEPAHFSSLATLPATFMKEHYARERPVHMRYRRPHIALNTSGDIVGCFWSPPFEGPLDLHIDDVERYYAAYAAFYRFLGSLMDSKGYQTRLRPGEVLVFNNRRMLHGRSAFATNGGTRHLRGAYVNIDDFVNRVNTLWPAHDGVGQAPAFGVPCVGNGDAANALRVRPKVEVVAPALR